MVGAHDAVQHAAVRPQFAVAAAVELRAGLDDADGLAGRALGGAEQAEQTRLQGAQGLVIVLLRQSALGAPAALAGTVALVRCAAVRADADCAWHGSIVPARRIWTRFGLFALERGRRTPELGRRVDSRRMPGFGCRTPDAGCRMPDAGCRMPDAGCRMPVLGCRDSDTGRRTLGF